MKKLWIFLFILAVLGIAMMVTCPKEEEHKDAICLSVNQAIDEKIGTGGVLTLEVTPEAVRLISADRGPGIPDVDLAMREGWATASETARSLGFGAGMGLPNMKRNADQFEIESELGKGTRISMRFSLT